MHKSVPGTAVGDVLLRIYIRDESMSYTFNMHWSIRCLQVSHPYLGYVEYLHTHYSFRVKFIKERKMNKIQNFARGFLKRERA